MNESDYNDLLSSLNDAIEILYRNRTPEPAFVAAYDSLKVARAQAMRVAFVARAEHAAPTKNELAAA